MEWFSLLDVVEKLIFILNIVEFEIDSNNWLVGLVILGCFMYIVWKWFNSWNDIILLNCIEGNDCIFKYYNMNKCCRMK